MLQFIIGLAAIAFIGKLAFQSLGKAQTLAILNRLFWILYGAWSLAVVYFLAWNPSTQTSPDTVGWFLAAPLIARYAVIFVATGRLGGHR